MNEHSISDHTVIADNIQKVYEAIVYYRVKHGFSPTVRELIRLTPYQSTSGVAYALQVLRREGAIDWVNGLARTIIIKEE